jgi:hypothetical protein
MSLQQKIIGWPRWINQLKMKVSQLSKSFRDCQVQGQHILNLPLQLWIKWKQEDDHQATNN